MTVAAAVNNEVNTPEVLSNGETITELSELRDLAHFDSC